MRAQGAFWILQVVAIHGTCCILLIHLSLACHSDGAMCDAGWALCGHETPAGEAGQHVSTDSRAHTSNDTSAAPPGQADRSTAVAEPAHDSCNGSSRPEKHVADGDQVSDDSVILLSRTERMALGQKCKQLIDVGRVLWLAEQGFQASLFRLEFMLCCAVSAYDVAHEALTSACASLDYTSASSLIWQCCRCNQCCMLTQRSLARTACCWQLDPGQQQVQHCHNLVNWLSL